MSNYTVNPNAQDSGNDRMRLAAYSTASTTTSGSAARQRIPFSIPASQLYYWSDAWQREELASMADYARGDFDEFENVDAAIRFLLRADD